MRYNKYQAKTLRESVKYVDAGFHDMFLFPLLAGGICLLILLITVSFHSVKTSYINPGQLLRDE